MDTRHLDEELPIIRTYDALWDCFEAAQSELIRKYNLPKGFVAFGRELNRRILNEDIPEEPAVTRWQSLYSSILDWASEQECEQADENPPPTQELEACRTEAAAVGGLFFAWRALVVHGSRKMGTKMERDSLVLR